MTKTKAVRVHKRASTSKAISPCRSPTKKSTRIHKKARIAGSASKRLDPDAHVDYEETHVVTGGKFEGFQGTLKRKESNTLTLTLIKNKRGGALRQQLEVEVKDNEVDELNHLDMLKISSEQAAGDEEDPDLLAFEKTIWTCSKCKADNKNDESICKTKIGEGNAICGGRSAATATSNWEGCFQSVAFTVSLQFECWFA
jgi:hypothetical protein